MRLYLYVLLSSLFLSSCSWFKPTPWKEEYDYVISAFAPDCMESFVEEFYVEGPKGSLRRGGGGPVGLGRTAPDFTSWRPDTGTGSVLVSGMDAPVRIYIRWQSLMEPETYEAELDVPQSGRELLGTRVNKSCYEPGHPLAKTKGNKIPYYRYFLVGVAPGGKVSIWLDTSCSSKAVPQLQIAKGQGHVFKNGPYFSNGKSHGYYETDLSMAKDCINKNGGIPYHVW